MRFHGRFCFQLRFYAACEKMGSKGKGGRHPQGWEKDAQTPDPAAGRACDNIRVHGRDPMLLREA